MVVYQKQSLLFSRMTCVVKGKPTPTIKWVHNGVEVPDSDDFKRVMLDDGTCQLILADTLPEDAGDYICEATNPLGMASTTAKLNVKGKGNYKIKNYKIA